MNIKPAYNFSKAISFDTDSLVIRLMVLLSEGMSLNVLRYLSMLLKLKYCLNTFNNLFVLYILLFGIVVFFITQLII